jgi:hypothetical protein
LPASRCSTFGCRDRIRVPSPAAKIKTPSCIDNSPREMDARINAANRSIISEISTGP